MAEKLYEGLTASQYVQKQKSAGMTVFYRGAGSLTDEQLADLYLLGKKLYEVAFKENEPDYETAH